MSWRRADVVFCVITLAGAYALKRHYSGAAPDDLRWILQPTATLVEIITGIHFEREAGVGWVSRETWFVIAKPCAGVNFMIVAGCAAVLGFVRTRRTLAGKAALVAGSALAGFAAALLANTARIAVALPLHTEVGDLGFMTRERLHRVEGVLVYTVFLCLFYLAARKALRPCGSR